MRTLVIFLLGLCAALAAPPAAAQTKYVAPGSYQRATITDDEGLLQWADYAPADCPNCKGTKVSECDQCRRFEGHDSCIGCNMKPKEAVCRACAGQGHFPDPLEHVHCPGCMAAGYFPCFVCGGGGRIKVEGSGDRWLDCPGCRGDGGFPCAVCKGKRLVDPAKPRPDLQRARLDKLREARETVTQVFEALKEFTPGKQRAREDVKQYEAIVKPATKVLPPLRRAPDALGDVMQKIYAGNQFKGSEEMQARAIAQWCGHTLYYLEHQQHLLDLCIARAEHNEKVLEEKKNKKGETP